jgi:hypothetical protein
MAKGRSDIAAAVAGDGVGLDSKHFGRRLHTVEVATASRRFNKLWGAY